MNSSKWPPGHCLDIHSDIAKIRREFHVTRDKMTATAREDILYLPHLKSVVFSHFFSCLCIFFPLVIFETAIFLGNLV